MSERDSNGSPVMTQALCEAKMAASVEDRRRIHDEMKDMEKEFDEKLVKACALQAAEVGRQVASMKAYIAGALAATTLIITAVVFLLNFFKV